MILRRRDQPATGANGRAEVGPRMLRRGLAVVMATAAIFAASAFATGPADPDCHPGNVCVYDSAGRVIYQNGGDISGRSIGLGSRVWNNGNRHPGFDHITIKVRVPSGVRYRMCLHYGPQNTEGADPTAALLGSGWVVTDWTWRGECRPDEDQYWDPFLH